MGPIEAFWLGVIFGPFIWAAVVIAAKLFEDFLSYVERKLRMRKWDKDQKRKDKLERELAKLNGREC